MYNQILFFGECITKYLLVYDLFYRGTVLVVRWSPRLHVHVWQVQTVLSRGVHVACRGASLFFTRFPRAGNIFFFYCKHKSWQLGPFLLSYLLCIMKICNSWPLVQGCCFQGQTFLCSGLPNCTIRLGHDYKKPKSLF